MKAYLPVIVILVLIGLGSIFLLASQKNNNQAPASITAAPTVVTTEATEPTEAVTPSSEEATSAASAEEKTITISTSGVDNSSLTVTVGTKVTWMNNSGKSVQIASDPHPQHTAYPPLNGVGIIADRASNSFTFTEAGTYGWHNHFSPTIKGKVIVK